MTVCPFCKSAGQQFPLADPEFSVAAPDDAGMPGGAAGCSAGCATCSHPTPGDDAGEDDATEVVTALMLTCPTCDEPFAPQYLKHCEWCGHEFPDGTEIEVRRIEAGRPEEPTDPLTPQAIATAVVLALLAVAGIGWLLWVM